MEVCSATCQEAGWLGSVKMRWAWSAAGVTARSEWSFVVGTLAGRGLSEVARSWAARGFGAEPGVRGCGPESAVRNLGGHAPGCYPCFHFQMSWESCRSLGVS